MEHCPPLLLPLGVPLVPVPVLLLLLLYRVNPIKLAPQPDSLKQKTTADQKLPKRKKKLGDVAGDQGIARAEEEEGRSDRD